MTESAVSSFDSVVAMATLQKITNDRLPPRFWIPVNIAKKHAAKIKSKIYPRYYPGIGGIGTVVLEYFTSQGIQVHFEPPEDEKEYYILTTISQKNISRYINVFIDLFESEPGYRLSGQYFPNDMIILALLNDVGFTIPEGFTRQTFYEKIYPIAARTSRIRVDFLSHF